MHTPLSRQAGGGGGVSHIPESRLECVNIVPADGEDKVLDQIEKIPNERELSITARAGGAGLVPRIPNLMRGREGFSGLGESTEHVTRVPNFRRGRIDIIHIIGRRRQQFREKVTEKKQIGIHYSIPPEAIMAASAAGTSGLRRFVFRRRRLESPIRVSTHGRSTRVRKVPKISPKAMDTAMGMRN